MPSPKETQQNAEISRPVRHSDYFNSGQEVRKRIKIILMSSQKCVDRRKQKAKRAGRVTPKFLGFRKGYCTLVVKYLNKILS